MKQLALTLGIVAAMSGNAAGQARTQPRDLFLTDWHAPGGQRCEVLEKPVPLPSAAFDTARLYERIAHLDSGSVVLAWAPPDTAWRAEFGPRPDSLAIIESTLPDTLAEAIRDTLLAMLNRPVNMPLLLRIDLLDHPVLRVAPALVCRPAIIEGDEERYKRMLRALRSGPRRAIVGLVVRPDGSVTEARLRTASGDPRFDATALEAVSLLRFSPGLLNRVPIPVFVAFPVQVR